MQRVPSVLRGLVEIGSLPSEGELARLRERGFQTLLNVSGVSLRELYGANATATLMLHEYVFSDVFSEVQTASHDHPSEYLSASRVEHREQFAQAVDALVESVDQLHATYLFCRQGVGRAPAVALAGMYSLMGGDLRTSAALIVAMRPQAMITHVTTAAARWYTTRNARP